MGLLLKNATVIRGCGAEISDIYVSDGKVTRPASVAFSVNQAPDLVFDFSGMYIFPGFADVHVHLREPGFSYKETVFSGTRAAARGGFCAVCSMPNLNPAPDCLKGLRVQLETIERDAAVRVFPYASVSRGSEGKALSDMEALAPYVAGFSDDGRGVQDGELMLEAMKKAKKLGKPIVAHCEDDTLLGGKAVHDGVWARKRGIKGISSESEWRQIERDLDLVRQSGCAYHVCHVSTKEGVTLIRKAKAEGLDLSCETAPHYLLLDDTMLKDDGAYRMNPPIRGAEDKAALIEGLLDGTVDMIATDHAPHSAKEKSGGILGSLNGISGLECAFAALYTGLVRTDVISLEKLIRLISLNPKRRFGIPGGIETGQQADLTVFALDKPFTLNAEDFISKGKSTPFNGMTLYGQCVATFVDGEKSVVK